MGDSGQEGPTLSASEQDLAPMSRDLEVVGMADHRPPLALDLSHVFVCGPLKCAFKY